MKKIFQTIVKDRNFPHKKFSAFPNKSRRKWGNISIFDYNIKLVIFSLIIFVINVIIILQMIPVLESQIVGAKFINLIIFPPNFIFEDVFGISSVRSIDVISWILLLAYDYLIAGILLYFMKGGTNKR